MRKICAILLIIPLCSWSFAHAENSCEGSFTSNQARLDLPLIASEYNHQLQTSFRSSLINLVKKYYNPNKDALSDEQLDFMVDLVLKTRSYEDRSIETLGNLALSKRVALSILTSNPHYEGVVIQDGPSEALLRIRNVSSNDYLSRITEIGKIIDAMANRPTWEQVDVYQYILTIQQPPFNLGATLNWAPDTASRMTMLLSQGQNARNQQAENLRKRILSQLIGRIAVAN